MVDRLFHTIYRTCAEAKKKGIDAKIVVKEVPSGTLVEENCGLKVIIERTGFIERVEYRLRSGQIGVLVLDEDGTAGKLFRTGEQPPFDGYGVRYFFKQFTLSADLYGDYRYAKVPVYVGPELISMHDPLEDFYSEWDRLIRIKKIYDSKKHTITIGDAKLIWSDTGTQEVAVYGDANVLDLVEKLIPFESFVVIIPSRTENAFMEIHKPGVRNQILSTTRSLVAEALKQLSISSLQEYKGSDLQKVIMSLNNNVMQYEYVLNEPTRRVLRLAFSKVKVVENGKYEHDTIQNIMFYYQKMAFMTGRSREKVSKITRALRNQYGKDIPVVFINKKDADVAKALGMIDGELII